MLIFQRKRATSIATWSPLSFRVVGWGLLKEALKPALDIGFLFYKFDLFPVLFPGFALDTPKIQCHTAEIDLPKTQRKPMPPAPAVDLSRAQTKKNPAQCPGCNPATGAGPIREVNRGALPLGADYAHQQGGDTECHPPLRCVVAPDWLVRGLNKRHSRCEKQSMLALVGP